MTGTAEMANRRKVTRMAKVENAEGLVKISLFWPDLTKRTQNQIRKALNIPENEDNNWTYIPMTIMEINEESIDEQIT